MLNIQYGSREFNLPYAVTKTIGEVSYVVLQLFKGVFVLNLIVTLRKVVSHYAMSTVR